MPNRRSSTVIGEWTLERHAFPEWTDRAMFIGFLTVAVLTALARGGVAVAVLGAPRAGGAAVGHRLRAPDRPAARTP